MNQDEKEEYPHPDFVKGYNLGYALAQYAPEIGGIFGMYVPESELGKGFRAGKSMYALNPTKKPEKENETEKSSSNKTAMEQQTERRQEKAAEYAENRADLLSERVTDDKALTREFDESKSDMGLDRSKDHYTAWLKDDDEPKLDADLDRNPDMDKDGFEPDRD